MTLYCPKNFNYLATNLISSKNSVLLFIKNILDKKEKYEKLPKDLKKIQNYILERV